MTESGENGGLPWKFDDLRALFINCTLKRSPELSHTQGLIEHSTAIMARHGVAVDVLRAVDHDIATGVWPMTWNLLHLARLLKDAGGIPAHGNQRSEWEAGCRFDFANPDYR